MSQDLPHTTQVLQCVREPLCVSAVLVCLRSDFCEAVPHTRLRAWTQGRDGTRLFACTGMCASVFFFSPLDARDVVCNDNGGWQITLTHTLSPVLDPGYNKKSVGSLNILIKLNGAHPRPGLDDELCTFEDKQDHLLRGRHQIHVFFFFFFFFYVTLGPHVDFHYF